MARDRCGRNGNRGRLCCGGRIDAQILRRHISWFWLGLRLRFIVSPIVGLVDLLLIVFDLRFRSLRALVASAVAADVAIGVLVLCTVSVFS